MKIYYKWVGILIFIRSVCLGGEEVETYSKLSMEGKEAADKASEDLTPDDFKLPGDSILKLEKKNIVRARIKQFENERNAEMAKTDAEKAKKMIASLTGAG